MTDGIRLDVLVPWRSCVASPARTATDHLGCEMPADDGAFDRTR